MCDVVVRVVTFAPPTRQGVGPYTKAVKKLEKDIEEEMKRINELIGACRLVRARVGDPLPAANPRFLPRRHQGVGDRARTAVDGVWHGWARDTLAPTHAHASIALTHPRPSPCSGT